MIYELHLRVLHTSLLGDMKITNGNTYNIGTSLFGFSPTLEEKGRKITGDPWFFRSPFVA
jgi:hypothetical protein